MKTHEDVSDLFHKQFNKISSCVSDNGEINCVNFSQKGRFALAGHKDGTINVWDTHVSIDIPAIAPSVRFQMTLYTRLAALLRIIATSLHRV